MAKSQKSVPRPTTVKEPSKQELQKQVSSLEHEVKRLEKALAMKPASASTHTFWRRFGLVVFTIITAILLNFSIFAVWLRRSIVNTDVWVQNSTQIIESPSVRDRIASQTAAAIIEKSDAQSYIADVLPERAKPLAPTLTSSLQSYTSTQINQFMQTPEFNQIWQNASRSAHTGIIQSLEAASSGNTANIPTDTLLYIKDKQLMLNLQPVVIAIRDRLVNRGLTFASRFDGSNAPRVQITEINDMTQLLAAFNLLNKAAVALPTLTLLSLIVTMALAVRKRKALIGLMLVFVAACVLNVQSVYFARYPIMQAAANASTNGGASAPAATMFSILTRELVLLSRIVMGTALVVALIAYLAGPGKLPRAIRRSIKRFIGSFRMDAAWVQWTGHNAYRVLAAVVGLGAVLIVFPPVAGATFAIIVFVVTVVLAALLYWLHQQFNQ